MSPTQQKYPLSKKKIIKKTIVQSIGCSIVLLFFNCIGLFAFLAAITSDSNTSTNSTAIIIFVCAILFWVGLIVLIYLYQVWYYRTYFYDIKEDYLMIRKGPITPNEINIVYQKIQDVYVDQDLFDRIFGLYDVHLATATFTSNNLAHIDGLTKENADGLKQELLAIFKKKVNTK